MFLGEYSRQYIEIISPRISPISIIVRGINFIDNGINVALLIIGFAQIIVAPDTVAINDSVSRGLLMWYSSTVFIHGSDNEGDIMAEAVSRIE